MAFKKTFQRTIKIIAFLVSTGVFFPTAVSFASPLMPQKFGQDAVFARVQDPRTWSPETMFEHVDGEAELLKRYGARGLIHALYEHGDDKYLSVDLLDMGAPINAYGLYRLYAGCDGEEITVSGATVLPGDWTYYARRGQYFMKMDIEARDSRRVMMSFLAAFEQLHPAPGQLPDIVSQLERLAGKPCDVNFHPEDVDYDLKAGPGYSWTGPDGGTFFLRVLGNPKEARAAAAALRDRKVITVLVRGATVAWSGTSSAGADSYLENVLNHIVR